MRRSYYGQFGTAQPIILEVQLVQPRQVGVSPEYQQNEIESLGLDVEMHVQSTYAGALPPMMLFMSERESGVPMASFSVVMCV